MVLVDGGMPHTGLCCRAAMYVLPPAAAMTPPQHVKVDTSTRMLIIIIIMIMTTTFFLLLSNSGRIFGRHAAACQWASAASVRNASLPDRWPRSSLAVHDTSRRAGIQVTPAGIHQHSQHGPVWPAA
jgi:hypothetical protein